jgi:tetratricopeptide (TPR) repeat protein
MRQYLSRLASRPSDVTFPRIWLAMTLEERAAGVRVLLEESPEKWRGFTCRLIAETRHFRVQTVSAWSIDKLANIVARVVVENQSFIAEAIVGLHMSQRTAMLCVFLDALGLPHEQGRMTVDMLDDKEEIPNISSAADALVTRFPVEQVQLYFVCLFMQNPLAFAGLALWLVEHFGDATAEPVPRDLNIARSASVASVPDQSAGAGLTDPHHLDGLTTLDRRIILAIVDSVSGIEGALTEDELDDMISEVIELNGRRHQGYFHAGFFDTLLKRPLLISLPADNMTRRRWYMAGCVVGLARENRWGEIAALYDAEHTVRGLGTTESLGESNERRYGPALQAGWLVFVALCRGNRPEEATSCLEAGVVHASPELRRELLSQAIHLIRTNRASEARGMLDLLWSARFFVSGAEDDAIKAFYLEVKRRRALCFRQLGEMQTASTLLNELALEDDRIVRASALTDIGLIKAGVRRLGELVIPSTVEDQYAFAEGLEKGKNDFDLAIAAWADVPGGHASFALGVLALARSDFRSAVRRLDAALTFFQGSPAVYQYDKTLSLAQLYLGLSICNTLEDAGRLPRACELIRQGLAGGVSLPLALLPRTLESLALVRDDLAMETAEAILIAAGSKALDQILDGTVGLSSVAIGNALFRRAADPTRGAKIRARDYRRALPMLLKVGILDRARDALEFLEELAERDIDRAEFLELLEGCDNYSPGWDIDRANASRIQMLECAGRFEEASIQMETECYRVLAVDDDHAYDDAVLMMERLEGYGPSARDSIARLSPVIDARASRVESVAESIEQRTNLEMADKTPVEILVVGGNEIQARMDAEIRDRIHATHPHVRVSFQHTGWNGNWRQHADDFERSIGRYDGVVFLSLMRTMLGRTIRQQCAVPWRGCGRGGQGAITGAILRVVPDAQRRIKSLVGSAEPTDLGER